MIKHFLQWIISVASRKKHYWENIMKFSHQDFLYLSLAELSCISLVSWRQLPLVLLWQLDNPWARPTCPFCLGQRGLSSPRSGQRLCDGFLNKWVNYYKASWAFATKYIFSLKPIPNCYIYMYMYVLYVWNVSKLTSRSHVENRYFAKIRSCFERGQNGFSLISHHFQSTSGTNVHFLANFT